MRTVPLAAITAFACRHAKLVLAAALLLSGLAMGITATRFAMTTDATALFAPDVPWRAAERRLDAAFPQNGDVTLVVIDGATPELAERAAAALTANLTRDHAHFRRVRRPDGGEFFARNGLMFGGVADVQAATARMIEAQPFLGPLAADPSLRGIATTLALMLDGVARGQTTLAAIDRPMRVLGDGLASRGAGHPTFFSWQALLGTGSGPLAAPTRRLVLVNPVLDYGSLMPGEPSSAAIRSAARALQLDSAHGVTLRLTGSVPLSDEEFASLAGDAWIVALVMVAAMLVTLRLATRSWRIVAGIAVTTLAGLVMATAVALLVAGRLNLISVAFIPLFVGLGVDFGIQLGVRFQAERLTHATPADAMTAAARALGASLLVAAGAVCLGFLAFVPTAYVGIAELGLIASIGMLIALALSVTLLPALLMLMPPSRPAREIGTPRLAKTDAFLIRHRRVVLILFGIAMLLSIASLAFVRFDFNPLHLRAKRGEAMATLTDLMHDPARNPNVIDILTPNIAAARRLAPKLAALPEVRDAITIESFVPADQPAKLAILGDAATLLDLTLNPLAPPVPASDAETVAALQRTSSALRDASISALGTPADDARALAVQLATLAAAPPTERAQASAMLIPPLETMLDQLRAALSAESVSFATLPPDLKQDWLTATGEARIQLVPRATGDDNAALARFVAAVIRIAPDATGPAVSMQAAAHTVAVAFVQAGLLALAIVTLLLFAVLRSLREVAFTLAPVVLSGFLTLGTCVLIGQPINFANIIAFPLLFGVGTAFHIYFVMAWRGGARDLLQSPLARAIFFSALATGSAFGALWLSHHPGTASMGKILMISLAWTLVCALIFEPALLGPQRKRPDD